MVVEALIRRPMGDIGILEQTDAPVKDVPPWFDLEEERKKAAEHTQTVDFLGGIPVWHWTGDQEGVNTAAVSASSVSKEETKRRGELIARAAFEQYSFAEDRDSF